MGNRKDAVGNASPPTGSVPDRSVEPSGPSASVSSEPSLAEETQAELERFRALVSEREDLLKRVQADFENSLKRTEREIERAERAAELRTVRRLLPLLDTIDAGLASEPASSDAHRTLAMVRDALSKTLTELGVAEIVADGVPFDAGLHEALMTRPGADGLVLEVVQKGYRLGDAILRHAKVVVGKHGGEDEPGSEAKRSDRPR